MDCRVGVHPWKGCVVEKQEAGASGRWSAVGGCCVSQGGVRAETLERAARREGIVVLEWCVSRGDVRGRRRGAPWARRSGARPGRLRRGAVLTGEFVVMSLERVGVAGGETGLAGGTWGAAGRCCAETGDVNE